MPSPRRNGAIDLIRATGAVFVAGFWHIREYSGLERWEPSSLLYRLVMLILALFFLTSGYLLAQAQSRAGGAPWPLVRKRLLRLYPPLLLASAAFWLFGITSGLRLIKAMLLVGVFWGPLPPTLWFMSIMLLFTVASPLLLRSGDGARRMPVVILALWLVLAGYAAWTARIDGRVLIYLPVFVAGIALGRENGRARLDTRLLTGLAIAACGLSYMEPHDPSGSLWSAPFALLGSLAVFVLLHGCPPAGPLIQLLSYASFMTYLLHRPIYTALLTAYMPESPTGVIAYLLVIGFPVTLAISIVAQRFFDNQIYPRMTWRPGLRHQTSERQGFE